MTGELRRRRETLRALGLTSTAEEPPELGTREPSVLLVSAHAGEAQSTMIETALAAECSISHVADPFTAAEVLTGAQFDAMVLMPEGDAERTLHLCSHIRNNPRLFNLPVLIVAERDSFEDGAIPYRRGASLVLTRPFETAELRDQVLSLVRRQRLRYAVRQGLATTLHDRTMDPFTGLYSSAFFTRHLSRLVSNAGLTQKPLSIVLFELQNIAWFERQYGAGAGDRVLRQVARWIAGLVRVEDLAARVTESMFAAILPDTSYDEALIVANRIAGVLLNTDFAVQDGLGADPLRVWIETGTAAAEPGDTVDGLVARAKARMR